MPDVTLRIKNLSFSLEALSRINCAGSGSLYLAVETLLKTAIEEAHKEQNPLRSSRTTIDDDDIPF